MAAEAPAQRAAHLAVADYFERHVAQREMTPRKAAEWPEQLHLAQFWDRLQACLTHIPLFLALYNDKSKWDLTRYWIPLRERGKDMGGCYRDSYARWAAIPANTVDAYAPALLGLFLHENAIYTEAEPLMRRMVEIFLKFTGATGHPHPHLNAAVSNYASLLAAMGQSREQIAGALQELGQRYSVDLGDVAGLSANEPSPKPSDGSATIGSQGDDAQSHSAFGISGSPPHSLPLLISCKFPTNW